MRKDRVPRMTRAFAENFKPFMHEFAGKETHVLEIGVFRAGTSRYLLKNILDHPRSNLVGIDPWDFNLTSKKQFSDTDEGRTAWNKLIDELDEFEKQSHGKIIFHTGFSQDVLWEERFPKKMFNLIYIDGHHTIMSVLRDFALTWPLLAINGIMVFDDCLSKRRNEVRRSVSLILEGLGERKCGPNVSSIRFGNSRPAKHELLFRKNNQVGIRKIGE